MGNSQSTRDLIISKAFPIFNTKGYRTTSISDITKATGITKGAIYGNFENKDAVAVAAFEYAADKVIKILAARIRAQPTAPLKLKAIMDYHEEYILNPVIEGGCPLINTSVEADDNYPLLRARVVRVIGILKESIQKIMYRGIKEKQLSSAVKVDEFATFFYASIEGAILISRVEGDKTTYQMIRKVLESQIKALTIK
ncbi:MAG: TetR/AcrR family transcriptional regulator [Cyclobacteriaceae bacterium]